jgi:hypothetical protein
MLYALTFMLLIFSVIGAEEVRSHRILFNNENGLSNGAIHSVPYSYALPDKNWAKTIESKNRKNPVFY